MAKDVPQRSCVACRVNRGKAELLRFVLGPERLLVPDLLQKLPGRGVYTCWSSACVASAAKKRQFARSLGGEVQGAQADVLLPMVRERILERIAGYIALANKGGKVVSGSDQVLEQLKKGATGLLFLASDISADIGGKFRAVAKLKGVRCAALFDKERLGALLGKELRSVLAVQESGFIGPMTKELEKYRNFFEEECE